MNLRELTKFFKKVANAGAAEEFGVVHLQALKRNNFGGTMEVLLGKLLYVFGTKFSFRGVRG